MTGRLRVAIVGVGPKGLFALEQLLHHAPDVAVDLFEPHPFPGAGPVYDPRQPPYLRMNFAASQVDLWPPGTRAVAAADRQSFSAWSAANGLSGDEYPPRAEVGEYLGAGLAALRRHAEGRARVTLRRERVGRVARDGTRWSVTTPSAARTYDEVLLATGHAPPPVAERLLAWSHAAPLVPAVYPAERLLAPDAVPAGAVVAVRGFALTFLDAALALTEGRGASFVPLAHPWRVRYVPAADAVRAILPFSRTGRPMLAKPAPAFADGVPDSAAIRGAARIRALAAPVALRRDLLPVLAEVADASGASGAVRNGAAASIARSLDIACGLAPPDAAWARGQAWRALYPAIVERLGHDGLRPADWPEFLGLAAEMERLAFGPPVVNAAKLVALVEAGVVDLAHVRGGALVDRGAATALRSAAGATPVDVVVDAVLPGPGADGHTGPAAGLVAAGDARIAPGRRGLDVCEDGTCRAGDGSRSEGLAAIGRPTEDSVIGNDTLSRTLHPLADRWARRVASRARAGGESRHRDGVPA